jgi:hypothetical protein
VTVPLPLPLVLLKVTHVTGLFAVQEQAVSVLTTMLEVPPAARKGALEGEIENVQGTAPSWVTVWV